MKTEPPDSRADAKAKRLTEIKTWLASFERVNNDVKCEYIEDAAVKINEYYWLTVARNIKPKMRRGLQKGHHIDRHKIISATEMTIMEILPAKINSIVPGRATLSHGASQNICRKTNAYLALHIGQSILFQWLKKSDESLDFEKIKDEPFEKEHLVLLANASNEGFPIFSNASTWYMYENYLRAKHFLPESDVA